MSKKEGFHHYLVVQSSFLPPSTSGLPSSVLLLSLFFWTRHCFLFSFWQPATVGLQDRGLAPTYFSFF